MRRAIVVVCVVCGFAATAIAQSRNELARAHYKAGAAYYQRGKYADAIREFEQSHELSKKADILYNLAQCHDKLGQRDKVVGYLRRYLKDKPKADDREQVEAWLGNLERALAMEKAAADRAAAEQKAATDRAAADRAAADRAAADRAAADRRAADARAAAEKTAAEKAALEKAALERAAATTVARPVDDTAARRARQEAREAGAGWRIVGDIGLGVGIVAMIGGAVPGVMAFAKARNLEDKLNVNDGTSERIFTTSLQSDYRNGPGLETMCIGLVVAGSAIVIAGAVSLWYGKKLRRNAEAKLLATPGLAGSSLAWRF